MPVVPVVDPSDARLDDYRDLARPRRRDAVEAAGGFFVAEGATVVRRLIESPLHVRSVLLTPARLAALELHLGRFEGPVLVAEPEVLAATVGFDLHRGVVASADRPAALDPWTLIDRCRTVAVLEGVNDHENLGAVARSAAALGIDALLLDPTCCDPWYRRSVRVSMGALLALPHARLAPWPDALEGLTGRGWRLLALTPDPRATPVEAVHRGPGERVALLLGAEGPGLSAAALARAAAVRIPMAPVTGVDSLNVGHAAAIAFHRFGLPRG